MGQTRVADQTITASDVVIKIAGVALSGSEHNDVVSVEVNQHAHLPAMFVISLLDANLDYVDGSKFDLGKEVEISGSDSGGTNTVLVKGEITAIEPQFLEGMVSNLVIRGYDKSHRLYRETKTKAWLQKKDSEIAQSIASEAGLTGQVDATSTKYDHIYQHNQTDMAFLMQRAWRIGYECYVADGKLHFVKPPTSGSSVTVTWGEDLIEFSPRATLAEQVNEVQVKGWDVNSMKAIVGSATSAKFKSKIHLDGPGLAKKSFGAGKYIVVDQPVQDQAEANTLAQARLDERSGSFIQADGVAFRRPDIRSGAFIKIEGIGTKFSGEYVVTEVTHYYDSSGLKSYFVMRGLRTGLLAETLQDQAPVEKWPGVVTAIVTNTEDEDQLGRVKVKYPWMDDTTESDWMRVLGMGGGPERGFFLIPDVNDEVLVSFENGDFNSPFVLGGLWNGKHALPPQGADAKKNERPLVRSWVSKKGSYFAMYDDAEEKIELQTAKGHIITFSDKDQAVTLKTKGGMEFSLDDKSKKLTIDAGSGEIVINAAKNITMKGMQIAIQAQSKLEIKGATVDVTGQGAVNVKAATVNLG